ncbi:Gfo/Idh/MocA family oxidoreductase (plasmid) [Deinococcus radiomollis]|uniref:Gfo/Idh/MocA family protein n=1 Tax=Deinococcus radiomollis TaxID=468916 RepID=UPI00389290B8
MTHSPVPPSPLRVAVVGCGFISDIYFTNLLTFAQVEVVACADLNPQQAERAASQYGIPLVLTPEEAYAHPDIDLILNLTIPAAHAQVSLAALKGGKHVYNEKPLALALADAQEMTRLAEAKGLRIGCAPDTVLGAGLQTCRELVESGVIGEPVSATAFMANHGHESWHPNPDFYYQPGAGPMFDMGPYYLTALVNIMGPVERVSAMTRATFPERTITSQPRAGEKVAVNTPTHIAGQMAFHSGAIGTIITTFDVWGSNLPLLEIHGTEGSLSLPDPNTFGGPVRIKRAGGEWEDVEVKRPYAENSRGLGVAELAQALQEGRPHLASGDVAGHVLEIMHGFLSAAKERREVTIHSRPAQPRPLSASPLPTKSPTTELAHD